MRWDERSPRLVGVVGGVGAGPGALLDLGLLVPSSSVYCLPAASP